ncbi:uncharacterized protein V6R79_021411 [Siganus canaliculatus]
MEQRLHVLVVVYMSPEWEQCGFSAALAVTVDRSVAVVHAERSLDSAAGTCVFTAAGKTNSLSEVNQQKRTTGNDWKRPSLWLVAAGFQRLIVLHPRLRRAERRHDEAQTEPPPPPPAAAQRHRSK